MPLGFDPFRHSALLQPRLKSSPVPYSRQACPPAVPGSSTTTCPKIHHGPPATPACPCHAAHSSRTTPSSHCDMRSTSHCDISLAIGLTACQRTMRRVDHTQTYLPLGFTAAASSPLGHWCHSPWPLHYAMVRNIQHLRLAPLYSVTSLVNSFRYAYFCILNSHSISILLAFSVTHAPHIKSTSSLLFLRCSRSSRTSRVSFELSSRTPRDTFLQTPDFISPFSSCNYSTSPLYTSTERFLVL